MDFEPCFWYSKQSPNCQVLKTEAWSRDIQILRVQIFARPISAFLKTPGNTRFEQIDNNRYPTRVRITDQVLGPCFSNHVLNAISFYSIEKPRMGISKT